MRLLDNTFYSKTNLNIDKPQEDTHDIIHALYPSRLIVVLSNTNLWPVNYIGVLVKFNLFAVFIFRHFGIQWCPIDWKCNRFFNILIRTGENWQATLHIKCMQVVHIISVWACPQCKCTFKIDQIKKKMTHAWEAATSFSMNNKFIGVVTVTTMHLEYFDYM